MFYIITAAAKAVTDNTVVSGWSAYTLGHSYQVDGFFIKFFVPCISGGHACCRTWFFIISCCVMTDKTVYSACV